MISKYLGVVHHVLNHDITIKINIYSISLSANRPKDTKEDNLVHVY